MILPLKTINIWNFEQELSGHLQYNGIWAKCHLVKEKFMQQEKKNVKKKEKFYDE